MKKISLITLLSLMIFASCKKDNVIRHGEIDLKNPAIYVLNEGTMGLNNAGISYCEFYENGSWGTSEMFYSANDRKLGDVANDILIYGEKIYITVGGSSTLEITDLKLKSRKQISLKNAEKNREPHGLAAHNGKIYIACFDGNLLRLDTSSLELDGLVKVGDNPENVAISGNYAFVTNSGGLNFQVQADYDSTVSVIDLSTFTQVKRITVGRNPFSIGVNESGDIFVGCRGNYSDEGYSLHRINASTQTYVKKYDDITPADFVISGNTLYYYNFDWSTMSAQYVKFDTESETVIDPHFLANPSDIKTPYAINVDKASGDIYLSDSPSAAVSGKAFIFNANGEKRSEIMAEFSPKKIVKR